MQQSIKSLIPLERHYTEVEVFGYATKGLPGLELVGLGKSGRNIKEKMIYLTRQEGLSLAKRRYVICIETDHGLKNVQEEELRWLELPILLLYWTLAQSLPIHCLKNCFCIGKVRLDGGLPLQRYPKDFIKFYENSKTRPLFLVHQRNNLPASFDQLELEELLEGRLEYRENLDRQGLHDIHILR